MTIKEAKQEIRNSVRSYLEKNEDGSYRIPVIRQRPILLIGPPGVGKTQIMEQVASECEIGLVSYTITHHTRQTAVGLPFIRDEVFDGKTYSVTEYTMSEIIASIHRTMRDTGKREGLLFIDEINCVSETLAPTMLQFLQNKTFGNQPVPEGWIIVAAGNPPAYNKSVREFDVVTLDRVRQIFVEPDYEVWEEYAINAGVHRAIRGYLKLHPDHFYIIEQTVSGKSFVTARGWEDFSHLLTSYLAGGIPVTGDVIREYLPHPDVAEELAVYLELFTRYEEEYPIDSILAGQVPGVIYERLLQATFDERVAVVELLLTALTGMISAGDADGRATEQAVEHVFDFMENAFGDGEEMVIFVTELTLSAECVMWLAEHPNEKYLHYSERLLIGARRGKILEEISSL